jgi:hypothetical protein
VVRHGYVITFYEINCTISKSGKIITELREMYRIVSSDSLVGSRKVELFAYYILSDIELWYCHLGHTRQSKLQQWYNLTTRIKSLTSK